MSSRLAPRLLPLAALAPLAARAQTYSNSIAGVYTVTQDTGGDVPLASKHFAWPDLPYQADTGNGPRGTQQGYNICNSTTQNQGSWCQTGIFNNIMDFCVWGSPNPAETVADVEEEMVAYCTTPKWGTRLLTAGSLQGVQFIQTPDYIEIVGYIDQTALNLTATDTGGEEDPHGADSRGNPLGSLLYTNAFNATNPGTSMQQVIEWSYFVGNGQFCFKACDPNGPAKLAPELCQHVYDEVGCNYNDPANYAQINGTFVACKGDNQLPAGEYVNAQGATTTWIQTDTPPPYTASIPPSSSCTTYTSSAIYTQMLGAASSGATGASSGASAGATGSQPKSTGGSSSGSGAPAGVPQPVGAAFWAAAVTLSAVVCGFAML